MLLHRDVTWRRWRKIAMSMGSSMGWTSKRLRSEGRGGRPRLVLGNGPRYMICVTHFCTLRELKNLRPCENRVRFLHGSRCNSRMAVRFWLAQRAKACDASGASGLPNSTLSVPTIPATSTHPNAGPTAKIGWFPAAAAHGPSYCSGRRGSCPGLGSRTARSDPCATYLLEKVLPQDGHVFRNIRCIGP